MTSYTVHNCHVWCVSWSTAADSDNDFCCQCEVVCGDFLFTSGVACTRVTKEHELYTFKP